MRVGLHLPPMAIEDLAKIPFLVQQPDPHHRDIEVAGRLEVVPGQDPQATSIERQRPTQPKLHAEVSHGMEAPLRIGLSEPARLMQAVPIRLQEPLKLAGVAWTSGQFLESFLRNALQNQPGVLGQSPDLWI